MVRANPGGETGEKGRTSVLTFFRLCSYRLTTIGRQDHEHTNKINNGAS